MRITVIGTGYVGSVTGACLSYLGHAVTCVDTDQVKIAKWQRGEAPIYEPYLAELIDACAERGGRSELPGGCRAQHRGCDGRLAFSCGGEQEHSSGGFVEPGGDARLGRNR